MKKQIIKATLFIIILVLILLILSSIFLPKGNTSEYLKDEELRAHGILGEPDNTIDLVIVGDSEAFTCIIPKKLWNDCGYTSYAVGTTGQVLPDTIEYVNKIYEKQNPKIIMLETNNVVLKPDSQYSTLLIKIGNKVMPIIKYHDRWKNLKIEDFIGKKEYTNRDENKGYYASASEIAADSSNYMQYTQDVDELEYLNKIYVKIINEKCKKNGTQLILLSSPNTKNYSYAKHNALEKFAKQEGIELLDLNMYADEIGINWNEDTRDGGDHLNNKGAEKVTNYIEKYLNGKNLVNHKNDKKYQEWNNM